MIPQEQSPLFTWVKVAATGTPPSPRSGHTAVLHEATMFVFGGFDGAKCYNDLFSFNINTNVFSPIGLWNF